MFFFYFHLSILIAIFFYFLYVIDNKKIKKKFLKTNALENDFIFCQIVVVVVDTFSLRKRW
jgi:hypothetical protein